MYLRVAGGLIAYVFSIALLLFACLHDLNVQAKNSRSMDIGPLANQTSVVDSY